MTAVEPPATPGGDANVVAGDLHGFDLLRPFNLAGVLAAADVHAAVRLCAMAGTGDPQLALAVAMAVRAPRLGHVAVDLTAARSAVVDVDEEVDPDRLPWPDPADWIERVSGSELVAAGTPPGPGAGGDERGLRPLVLDGAVLYLERYWRDEVAVAAEIIRRLHPAGPVPAGPADREERLRRLFPGPGADDQIDAARLALSGRFTVIAGGPGTGKTTTVARLLAAVFEEAEQAGGRPPLVGLVAPTGKAAARMEEAVRAEAARLEIGGSVRDQLGGVAGSTVHRLLGTRFDRPGRFRHHVAHRLPHDMVVVDEASMVSLSLMARLVEAVGAHARLVLVGDPEQLVSVEAGAVLADIVGPGREAPPAGGGTPAPGASPAGSIGILRRNHRFAGPLATLSAAVRAGRPDEVLAVLGAGDGPVDWLDEDPAGLLQGDRASGSPTLTRFWEATAAWAAEVVGRADAGDATGAIEALRRQRVLCAHRRGPAGAAVWNGAIEGGLGVAPAGEGRAWYAGRPVLVTANDYGLRLFNGDTGVTVRAGAGPAGGGTAPGPAGAARMTVAFDEGRDRPLRFLSPTRLESVETVFAMTVHKSQGSEFDRVSLLLPAAGSRLLTREMLYTAITRARRAVTVVGTAEAVRAAVGTPVARASGLGPRLWGPASR